MHAGNIFAALVAWLVCKKNNGLIVLRIEDIDTARCKDMFATQIMKDYEALGLTWDEGPYYQHDHRDAYLDALVHLKNKAHVYPCFCSRADILAASAPHKGAQPHYAGTCRSLDTEAQERGWKRLIEEGRIPSHRIEVPHILYAFVDKIQGKFQGNLATTCGDFILLRSNMDFAYQLAVVVDDASEGITQITRGCDLMESTLQQRFLQDLLEIEYPDYFHVPLLVTKEGRRLSKRDNDAAYPQLLAAYKSPEGILGHIAFVSGMISSDEPVRAQDLLHEADISALSGRTHILWE